MIFFKFNNILVIKEENVKQVLPSNKVNIKPE